jgi:pimeloyl-ACP methyl ester carboxylesterase
MTPSCDVGGGGTAVMLLDSTVCDRRIDPADITAPSLLISGHDLADFRQIAAHLSGQVPNTRHLDFSWAGHLPRLERSDEVNRSLVDFLHETLGPR